jgi:hypothetical protein
MSKERPILFNTEMVRKILSGEKTQTRRIVKPQPQKNGGNVLSELLPYKTPVGTWTWVLKETGMSDGTSGKPCPYGDIGDFLWVRETFASNFTNFLYRADTESWKIEFSRINNK